MGLSGFGNPVTPDGATSLVEAPPHHISADAIQVIFRLDPALIARYLPQGLEPTKDGLAYAYVADMIKVSEHDPEQASIEPQRTQYGEGIVGFYCQHRGSPGRYSAFIYVDRDWSLAFGLYMGFAKKLATIHRTRIHEANPAMGPIDVGTELRGTVDRMGSRIIDVGIELTERLPDDGIPSYGHRVYTYRHLPSPSPDVPPSRELLALDLAGARTINCWRGSGSVRLSDGVNDKLGELAPLEIVDAFAFQRGWTTKQQAELIGHIT